MRSGTDFESVSEGFPTYFFLFFLVTHSFYRVNTCISAEFVGTKTNFSFDLLSHYGAIPCDRGDVKHLKL